MKTKVVNLALAALLIPPALPAADSKSPPPATVANAVKETDLNTIKLTPQAEQRLGIVLAEIHRKRVNESRLFGGDVIVPLAPKGEAPAGYFPLAAGTHEELLKLVELQATADGEVEKVKVQLEAAQVTLQRAEKLVQSEAGSVRAVDEARAQVRLAEKTLELAKARRVLLGAPVAEAIQGKRVWVRVAVYAGELPRIAATNEAKIGSVAARPGEREWPAKPVSAPASANAATATVDLFYEVSDAGEALVPGQRVSVSLPLRGETESLVVPWAAVLHDIHGNTWVYESTAPQTYVRRRVVVTRVAGADAVLASGPKPGTKVVTSGAAELFGTEFGGTK